MGSLSIWHWLIVTIAIGAFVIAPIYTAGRTRSPLTGEPQGFGGWLLILAIGQSIGLLSAIGAFIGLLERASPTDTTRGAVLVAVTVLVAWTTIAMWRRHFTFQRLFVGQSIALVIAALWSFADRPTAEMMYAADLAGVIVISALWAAYVLRSARVRNTFTRGHMPTSAPPTATGPAGPV
jgi:hypothetical protein